MIIQRATQNDIDAIDHLMWRVYHSMENKELFVPDDRAFIERHIEEEGFILIAVNDSLSDKESLIIEGQKSSIQDRIQAFLMVRYPMHGADNLGKYLHLPYDAMERVVHMESAVVAPEARGRQLQRRLLQEAEKYILYRRNEPHYLMCTIDPHNSYSLNNAKKLGYEVIDTVPKYAGKIRSILYKKVEPC